MPILQECECGKFYWTGQLCRCKQKSSASARMAGYKADDVADAVRYECEEFSAQHEKWKRGDGQYPSTAGIVKALADAGII